MTSGHKFDDEIRAYYEQGRESGRLLQGAGRLEFLRTQELLARYLPPPPAVVLDVGGGAGIHAFPLAQKGYQVHLIDPVLLHVEQARTASAHQPDAPLDSAEVGDARHLAQADGSIDAVLMLGPLYHLPERSDRLAALREAHRVLRPGGMLIAAAISRFASTLDGLFRGYLTEPDFEASVERNLQDGRHHNPSRRPGWFTTAYFHRPDDLRAECTEAGLIIDSLVAVEGPAWAVPELDAYLEDPQTCELVLRTVRRVESEPNLIGASPHFVVVGHRA